MNHLLQTLCQSCNDAFSVHWKRIICTGVTLQLKASLLAGVGHLLGLQKFSVEMLDDLLRVSRLQTSPLQLSYTHNTREFINISMFTLQ